MKKTTQEWVAIDTFYDERADQLIEAGRVYATEPHAKGTRGARKFEPGEHIARCPRCGERFANSEEGTAESCRDLHVTGDEDIPSICSPSA